MDFYLQLSFYYKYVIIALEIYTFYIFSNPKKQKNNNGANIKNIEFFPVFIFSKMKGEKKL